jgi:hypothetical protein
MKRLYFLPILFVLLIFAACNNRNKNTEADSNQDSISGTVPITAEQVQDISEVITRFVRAYSNKDNEKANRLIHPQLGLYIIYRPGAADSFMHTDSLDFNNPMPNYYPYPDFENEYALTFEELPVFSCNDFTWNKQGLFCDTTTRPTQLTRIALFENEFNEGAYSATELRQLEDKAKKQLPCYRYGRRIADISCTILRGSLVRYRARPRLWRL